MTPTFKQLAEAYRDLLSVSLAVNDELRITVEGPVYDGSENAVMDLREEANRHLHDWLDFIYPHEQEP